MRFAICKTSNEDPSEIEGATASSGLLRELDTSTHALTGHLRRGEYWYIDLETLHGLLAVAASALPNELLLTNRMIGRSGPPFIPNDCEAVIEIYDSYRE